MEAIKMWWQQASTRDQLALVVGMGFLSLYILYFILLKPVQTMRSEEQAKNNALRNSLENVRGLAAQVVAASSAKNASSQRSSLESIVQQSVASNGLQVSSMAASGKDGVRLRFDEAAFENVLKWLHEMEGAQRLKVKDLSVAAASSSGMVSVNLRLHQN